jgi:predicted nuclease with TOPRIM domain
MLNETQQNQIIRKHAEAAAEEIKAEEAKSTEQREAETLTAEVIAIAAQLKEVQRFPSQYREQIKTLTAQLEAKQNRLDQLTGKTPAKDWRIAANTRNQFFFDSSGNIKSAR